MALQALVLGGVHMKGTSNRTGTEYDFVQLNVATRVDPGGPVVAGAGYELDRVSATGEVLEDLRRYEASLPMWFRLDGEPARGGRLRVTSLEPLEV